MAILIHGSQKICPHMVEFGLLSIVFSKHTAQLIGLMPLVAVLDFDEFVDSTERLAFSKAADVVIETSICRAICRTVRDGTSFIAVNERCNRVFGSCVWLFRWLSRGKGVGELHRSTITGKVLLTKITSSSTIWIALSEKKLGYRFDNW